MTKCVIFGHTGAVGEFVLKEAMANPFFTRVTTLGRKKIDYQGANPDKLNQVVVDFDAIDGCAEQVKECGVVFCTLGTTRRQAGSAENFWKIDHDYVINTAKLIHEMNKTSEKSPPSSRIHFLYCSAKGADINSMFLYPKCKGTVEKDLQEMGFHHVSIFHPGLIEIEKDRTSGKRWGESIAFAVLPLVKMFSPHSFSCPPSTIAKAMVQLGTQTNFSTPYSIIDNYQFYELAKETKPNAS